MNLSDYIKSRLKSKKMLLMTHCVVGYPSLADNWAMLEAKQKADIDLVELQMPFSEPIADGPLFVKANQSAIQNGISINQYFEFMQKAAKTFSFPLFMMTYYNTVFSLGHHQFVERLSQAGGVGYILPDLPIEENDGLFALSHQKGLCPVQLFTPTHTEQRLNFIAQHATGLIYAVSRKGVTGSQTKVDVLKQLITRYRKFTDLPLALGFGISTSQDIDMLLGQIDIAILGSALLRCWETKGKVAYQALLKELSAAAHR